MASEAAPVMLSIPADPRLLRIARVTAASLAGDLPFTLQDIEDLRVAIDEAAAAAIEGVDPSASLALELRVEDGGLVVRGTVAGAGSGAELHPVAQELLSLLADHYEAGVSGTDRTFRLTKRPRSAAG